MVNWKYLVLPALIMMFSTALLAQQAKNGIIVAYAFDYPEMEANEVVKAKMPTALKLWIKGQRVRSETPLLMGSGIVTIQQTATKDTWLLLSVNKRKLAMKQTEADRKEVASKRKQPAVSVVFTGTVKTIAGYACKEAIVTMTSAKDTFSGLCYYTKELPAVKEQTYEHFFKDIDGFIMEFSLKQNGTLMHAVVKKVEKAVLPDDLFVVPETYEVVDAATLKEIIGKSVLSK